MTVASAVALLLLLAPPKAKEPTAEQLESYQVKLASCIPAQRPASKRNPKAAQKALEVGVKSVRADDPQGAVSAFEKCIVLDSRHLDCVRNLGIALAKANNEDPRAEACFLAYLELAPPQPPVLDDLCEHPACYEARGEDPPDTYRGVPYP